ncbi:hypothetical protein J7K50_09930 [bacterium]|nr:hypothetical protein [bacterium]
MKMEFLSVRGLLNRLFLIRASKPSDEGKSQAAIGTCSLSAGMDDSGNGDSAGNKLYGAVRAGSEHELFGLDVL